MQPLRKRRRSNSPSSALRNRFERRKFSVCCREDDKTVERCIVPDGDEFKLKKNSNQSHRDCFNPGHLYEIFGKYDWFSKLSSVVNDWRYHTAIKVLFGFVNPSKVTEAGVTEGTVYFIVTLDLSYCGLISCALSGLGMTSVATVSDDRRELLIEIAPVVLEQVEKEEGDDIKIHRAVITNNPRVNNLFERHD